MRPVGEHVSKQRLQLIVGGALGLSLPELRTRCEPALAPPARPLRIGAHQPGLYHASLPGGGPQHEGDTLSEAPRKRPGSRESLQDQPLTRRELDRGRVARHPILLILAIDLVKRSQLRPRCTRRPETLSTTTLPC